jgi:hypothetical protein
VELANERGHSLGTGDDSDRLGAAGDGDVEDSSLLLDVVGQAMGHETDTGVPDHHMAPLETLHPMDGGQGHGRRIRRSPFQRRSQPRLEIRDLGVGVGEDDEGIEIVGVAPGGPSPGVVEAV